MHKNCIKKKVEDYPDEKKKNKKRSTQKHTETQETNKLYVYIEHEGSNRIMLVRNTVRIRVYKYTHGTPCITCHIVDMRMIAAPVEINSISYESVMQIRSEMNWFQISNIKTP